MQSHYFNKKAKTKIMKTNLNELFDGYFSNLDDQIVASLGAFSVAVDSNVVFYKETEILDIQVSNNETGFFTNRFVELKGLNRENSADAVCQAIQHLIAEGLSFAMNNGLPLTNISGDPVVVTEAPDVELPTPTQSEVIKLFDDE